MNGVKHFTSRAGMHHFLHAALPASLVDHVPRAGHRHIEMKFEAVDGRDGRGHMEYHSYSSLQCLHHLRLVAWIRLFVVCSYWLQRLTERPILLIRRQCAISLSTWETPTIQACYFPTWIDNGELDFTIASEGTLAARIQELGNIKIVCLNCSVCQQMAAPLFNRLVISQSGLMMQKLISLLHQNCSENPGAR